MPTPNALVTEIEALSRTFATSIVDAMKRASLADILGASGSPGSAAPAKRGPGRPRKDGPFLKPTDLITHALRDRTAESSPVKRGPGRPKKDPLAPGPATIKLRNVTLIQQYVKSHPGETGEAIRKTLGLEKGPWNKAVSHCVEARLVTKKGEKRGTKYWPV